MKSWAQHLKFSKFNTSAGSSPACYRMNKESFLTTSLYREYTDNTWIPFPLSRQESTPAVNPFRLSGTLSIESWDIRPYFIHANVWTVEHILAPTQSLCCLNSRYAGTLLSTYMGVLVLKRGVVRHTVDFFEAVCNTAAAVCVCHEWTQWTQYAINSFEMKSNSVKKYH